MEGRANAGVGGEVQCVCNFIDSSKDFVWPIEAGCQFGAVSVADRGLAVGCSRKKTQSPTWNLRSERFLLVK